MAAVSKIEKGVVELRTDVGRLYVCPTGWQRLYLRWTFRNFHCLPQQVLNRRQKQLIERLWRNAIVTCTERAPASPIIGIVEDMRVLGLPSAAEGAEVRRADPAAHQSTLSVLHGAAAEAEFHSSAGKEQPPARRGLEITRDNRRDTGSDAEQSVASEPKPEHLEVQRIRTGDSWAVALVGAAAGAVLLLAFWLVPLWRVPQLEILPAPPPAPPLAAELKPASPVASASPHIKKDVAAGQFMANKESKAVAGRQIATPAGSGGAGAAPAVAANIPNPTPLPQIVEAPRSGFIYPVAPNPNLVGKVVLKAVVGSDGTVKQVAVLSGDRALAAAAVRAVRQWRYAPPEVGGHTVEAETHVTISFLGDDAVSIILPQQR